MKKLKRVEKLLKNSGVDGMKLIDTGTICTRCKQIFCECPMTDEERKSVKPKGYF